MSPPGDIRAYDVLTGKLVWTFHTVPRPGEFGYDTWPKDAWKYVGGVNNWGEMTVDAQRGASSTSRSGRRPTTSTASIGTGANLFGTSVVALEARTGKRLWHFQIVHHDLWDLDPSAAPQLTTIRHNGRNRDVVVVSSKTTWLYVLDRVTGEPIWPIEERPVPKSDMPGEQSWPTQPYPTNPPPHGRQTFGVDDISPYLTAAEADAVRKRLLGARNQGLFTPISYADTMHMPDEQRRRALRRDGVGSRAARSTSSPTTTRASFDWCGRARTSAAAAVPRRCRPGRLSISRTARSCHGPDRLGTDGGVPLVHAAADPANNIAAGAPRFDAAAIRAVVTAGKGRMPAFPHLTPADIENLVRS